MQGFWNARRYFKPQPRKRVTARHRYCVFPEHEEHKHRQTNWKIVASWYAWSMGMGQLIRLVYTGLHPYKKAVPLNRMTTVKYY